MILGPPANRPHVVIVGAGFGGLYAAKAFRRADVSVTVVDRRNHHLFQPLLYQVATAALSPGDIAYPIRTIVRRQKNTRVLLADVSSIDVDNRRVILRDGEISYDFLILAAGATDAYFGHDEWKEAAPGLKSLEAALEVRRRILLAFEKAEREADVKRRRDLMTFVVVGGGPTGVELAGAIAEIARSVMVHEFRAIDPRDARVVLVEAGPRLLSTFPADLADHAEKSLRAIGVEVWTGFPVTHIDGGGVVLGDCRIEAGTTLWAAGVQASPLGRSLGVPLDRGGRVIVQPDLTIPGHPEVFVIGDLAACADRGKVLPGVAPVAIQQGKHAAENVLRSLRKQPLEHFRYVNKGNLATIGRAAAIAHFGRIKIWGFAAWVTWLFVHILYLIGFRNRLVVMINWAWSYFRYKRAARLITGDFDQVPVSPSESAVKAGKP
jgi:NADH dehydrogenase